MRRSARRRYKATLAAVAAFTEIRQRVRVAATWVAVLELLDLEDDERTDDEDRGSHDQTTRSLRGRICFDTRSFSIPPPEKRSCFADASVFLTCFPHAGA